MPRLSDFARHAGGTTARAPDEPAPDEPDAGGPSPSCKRSWRDVTPVAGGLSKPPATAAKPDEGVRRVTVEDAVAATYQGKLYRQPDGSLQPIRPPRNPYTVANRKRFADLVKYARLSDGDEEATKTGKSLRYGINVPWREHRDFLATLGLQPEWRADGTWIGFDPSKTEPLADPEHPLHGFTAPEPPKVEVVSPDATPQE